MLLILLVTSYITTCLSFLIYCLRHHLFYLDTCNVTIYVTPTVGSLSEAVAAPLPKQNCFVHDPAALRMHDIEIQQLASDVCTHV